MEDGFYIGMTVALIFFLLGWSLANVGLSKKSNKS